MTTGFLLSEFIIMLTVEQSIAMPGNEVIVYDDAGGGGTSLYMAQGSPISIGRRHSGSSASCSLDRVNPHKYK